jgi:hypothetical protein
MSSTYGLNYSHGQSREVLYSSSGTTKDYMNEILRVPLSFTMELRDEKSFEIPRDQIYDVFDEVKEGLAALIDYMKNHDL